MILQVDFSRQKTLVRILLMGLFICGLDQIILAEGLNHLPRVPFSDKKNGYIGNYYLGQWPAETDRSLATEYANPQEFIEVTEANAQQQISKHFKLGDFIDKDQAAIWPKYIVLDYKLIEKLELIIDELKQDGVAVNDLAIMCGFRSPHSNQTFGDTQGRGKLSRHMFGDAADIYVDNKQNGWMADLNRDSRVDIDDARFLARAIERVEASYPSLKGGRGIYPGNGAHGPFVHTDVRGYAVQW